MDGKEDEKLSFTLPSKSHPPKPLSKSPSSSSSNIQFVRVFDPTTSPNPEPKLTIPPIPNSDLRRGGIDPIKEPEKALQKLREEIHDLPEARGADEFAEVPVDDFAPAVLAGYGWREGRGIGRNTKRDVKVVQYERRSGTQGLGYVAPGR